VTSRTRVVLLALQAAAIAGGIAAGTALWHALS
jgi:hypothetical protein